MAEDKKEKFDDLGLETRLPVEGTVVDLALMMSSRKAPKLKLANFMIQLDQ
jgi:hypothetical protein